MHIVIIGNGISGVTAARNIRKLSDYRISLISSESEYFFSRTALMYVYMGHMRWKDIEPYEPWFWEKNKIDLVHDKVVAVDTSGKTVSLQNSQNEIQYDKLIIATGSRTNKYGWPGQDLKGVCGLYDKQDLETIETLSPKIEHAVIVGGGLIGIELAEMFISRKMKVTLIVRENSYWSNVLPAEESELINQHIVAHKINLKLNTSLSEIIGDANGKVTGVILSDGTSLSCQFVGITTGVTANIDFLKDFKIEYEKGILVNDQLETSLKDIYAIGDCAQLRSPKSGRKSIEAVWYTGRMMGEVAAHNICGNPVEYDPGIWFNSAKFFDIEYQVYGTVPVIESDVLQSIFWSDASANKSIRIVYETLTQVVVGFNLMGIRYRHEVCEKWIREQTTLEEVLKNLHLANFDPEFYKTYEPSILEMYKLKTGKEIKRNSKKGLNAVLNFLNKIS